MIEVCVAGISTVLEPSAAASATTGLAGMLDGATLGAHENDATGGRCDGRTRGCCCGRIGQYWRKHT